MKDNEKMKEIIDKELKSVPLWKRNKRKREMIENIDNKIISLGEEWETNDESLKTIKKEINDQVEDIVFQIEDGLQQMYEIQTALESLDDDLDKLDDESEELSEDELKEKLDTRSAILSKKRELLQKHERLYTDIQRLKDKKLSLLNKVAEAEKEFEQTRGYITSNLRGLVETRTILEKPKEWPKWAERIPGELLKGLVAGGLLIVGLIVKEKMLDEGTSDKNTEYFVNNIGKTL